jgi:hypothetical protein
MPSLAGRHRGFGPALVRLIAVAVVALLMSGCGSGTTATVAHDNANGTTIHLSVGQRLNLVLSSSYWNLNGSSAPTVLRQDGPSSLLSRPSNCPDIPGVGCTPVQTAFTALAPGTAVITADRTTCGEALRCGPGQRRFSVTIVVQ